MFSWNYFAANEAAGFIAIFASNIMSSGKGIKFELVEISKLLAGDNWDLCNLEEPKQVEEVARYLTENLQGHGTKLEKEE